MKTMNKKSHAKNNTVGHHIGQLSEDAQALMAATADVAGEKVQEARERLGAALEQAKEFGEDMRDKADHAIRENPYPALAIAAGVGAVLGILFARK